MKKNNIFKKIKNNWQAWFSLALYISASLVLISAISTYYDDFLNLIWNNSVFKFLLSVGLLFILLILTNKARKRFSKISIPTERDLVERSFKALILPVSKARVEILSVDTNNDVINIKYEDKKISINKNTINKILNSEDNEAKHENYANFKNWQPPLVSILRNLKIDNEKGGIEQLWLLGSADTAVNPKKKQNESGNNDKSDEKPNITKGSARELKFFVQILLFFFKDKFDIYVFDYKNNEKIKIDEKNLNILSDEKIIDNIAVDFNDFGKVHETFKRIISKIIETAKEENETCSSQKRIKEHEIAIDITGGQKPISVAGAVSTLEYKTKIIYIDTNNIPNIKEIDATIENEPDF